MNGEHISFGIHKSFRICVCVAVGIYKIRVLSQHHMPLKFTVWLACVCIVYVSLCGYRPSTCFSALFQLMHNTEPPSSPASPIGFLYISIITKYGAALTQTITTEYTLHITTQHYLYHNNLIRIYVDLYKAYTACSICEL